MASTVPTFTVSSAKAKATAIATGITVDQLKKTKRLAAQAAQNGFEAKIGQTLNTTSSDGKVELLVGLGAKDSITANSVRLAAAAMVGALKFHVEIATSLATDVSDSLDSKEAVCAVVEGAGMASYQFTAYTKAKPTNLKKVVISASGAAAKAGLSLGIASVKAVCLARDLVNEPGGSLVPTEFVKRARVVARSAGLKIAVWDAKKIEAEKMGGIMAVNQGSTHPARFVTLTYTPTGEAEPKASIGLVGKGVTFDSGGLSIKSGQGMMSMKIDMSGAAAVLASMLIIAEQAPKVAVTAYMPLTDNMINGDAFRPGDVFTARNGKTVEVLNTDAEGRLILADALSVASEADHDAIIDIATLTGSVTAALGPKISGVMTNDDDLFARIETASESTGEDVWRLPLPEQYRKYLDSGVADLRNIGTVSQGGALTAGLFLSEFVSGSPWAHIDVGIGAIADSSEGYIPKGGTGVGVRLLAELVSNWG
jgi:leucyl aminopeptidase